MAPTARFLSCRLSLACALSLLLAAGAPWTGAAPARAQTSPFEDPATDLETEPVSDAVSGEEEEDLDDFLADTPVETGPDDPFEDLNRPIFNVNITLDRWIMRPITRMYMEAPRPARDGVSNMLDNLDNPIIFVNDLLQGEMSRAGATFGRFFINSIFGIAGFFDVADAMGLPGHDEDFGQTLASYGVPAGPYLMLPLFGPSNLRDVTGRIVDTGINPATDVSSSFIPEGMSTTRSLVNAVDARSKTINDTEALEETSLDLYAAVRSFYHQNREFEILNGRPAQEALPDMGR